MDPEATIKAIVDYLDDGEIDEAYYLIEALQEWIEEGGYVTPQLTLEIVRTLRITLELGATQ